MNGDAYLDTCGPLRADWRAGDSAWSLVDDVALGRVVVQVRDLDGHGELERFIAARRAPPEIGQVTFVAARRSIGYPGWRLQHRAELIDRLRRQWARCGRLRRSRTQP